MAFKHLYLFPIIVGVWFLLTFIITYTMAVLNKNVEPVFPYISDTGNWSPESCIFGLLLTTGAIFMVLIIYIRYRQVRELCERNDFNKGIVKLNRISLYLGIIACYGVNVVASFQETNVFVVHGIGAFLCFGFGTVYQIIQVRICFSVYPTIGNKGMNIFRIFCAGICCITMLLTGAFLSMALLEFKGDDITKWKKEDGGYNLHLVSSIAEWILAISTQCFLVTFTKEFRLIQFEEPSIYTKQDSNS